MLGLIAMFAISLFVLFVGGVFVSNKRDNPGGYIVAILGIAFLGVTTFLMAPTTLRTGSPAVSIDAGEYQVDFVYVAGDKVSVGIEREDINFGEGLHLFLYQFSRNAFEGGIREDAKKLVVVESGEFKKLRLE